MAYAVRLVKTFTDIRIFPSHGTRSAAITWTVSSSVAAGNVYVARSYNGLPETWQTLNPASPVASGLGLYTDASLDINSGSTEVYYRLMLVAAGQEDLFSEPVSIHNLVTPAEYGIARGIMHRLYHIMRSRNGYPVWWCVPLTFGTPSPRKDPDTDEILGLECPNTPEEESAYGLEFVGGFHPPVLTWIMPRQVRKHTKSDSAEETHVEEDDEVAVTSLAWPIPSRGHMLVEPVTDRRYLIKDEITPHMLRGILPVTFDFDMQYLPHGDPRYRFPMPEFDMRAYRKL